MSKIDSLPEGKIKKNGNYYGWAFIGVMFTVMGILAIVDKRFQYRSGTPAIEGDLAVIIGIIFYLTVYTVYIIYYLKQKKKKNYTKISMY